jgi:H+/Cl- antiporter ClcA
MFNLALFVLLKFIFTVLSLSLPCPNGIFLPLFSLGAVLGRFYGMVLTSIGVFFEIDLIRYEGLFAIVGSASLFGAATKTIAPALMFLELTG